MGNQARRLRRLLTPVKNAMVHDTIDQLPQKYDTDVGDRGSSLSGGEKQRITLWGSKENYNPIFRFDCGCREPFDLVLSQDFLAVINDDRLTNGWNLTFWKLWPQTGFADIAFSTKRDGNTGDRICRGDEEGHIDTHDVCYATEEPASSA